MLGEIDRVIAANAANSTAATANWPTHAGQRPLVAGRCIRHAKKIARRRRRC